MVDLLLGAAIAVRVIDNLVGGREANLAHHAGNPDLTFEQRDIRDLAAGRRAVSRASTTSSISPASATSCLRSSGRSSTWTVNVQGTVRVLECARARRRQEVRLCGVVVLLRPGRDADARGSSDRAAISLRAVASIRASRRRSTGTRSTGCRSTRSASSMPTARARAPPAPTARCSACFCKQKLAGKPFTVVGDGTQTPRFPLRHRRGRGLPARRPRPTTSARSGISAPAIRSRSIGWSSCSAATVVYIPKRPGEPDCTWADITKIQRELGWAAEGQLRGGVARMLADIDYWRDAPLWDPALDRQGDRRPGSSSWHRPKARRHDGRRKQRASSATRSRPPRSCAALIGPRPREKKVIMCHGTFDLVHPGHLRHLLYAKSKADILVASLTADAHITKAQLSARSCRRSCARSISPRSRWSTTSSSTPNRRRSKNIAHHPAGLFRQGLRIHQATACIRDTARRMDVDRGLRRRDHLHAGRHRLFVVAHSSRPSRRRSRPRSC